MKISLSIIFSVSVLFGFGQAKEIDSLKQVLLSAKDSNRVDCMNALSFQYIRMLNRELAEHYQQSAYNGAQKLNYIHGIAEAVSNESGIVEYFDNNFPEAEKLSKEAISWFGKTTNKNGADNAYDNLSFAFLSQSKYDECYQIESERYKTAVMLKNRAGMSKALGSMHVIEYQEGNYDSAFYFLQQGQQIDVDDRNFVEISSDMISYGVLYRSVGDYKTALNYYRHVFETDTKETIQNRIDGSYETWTRMEYAELFALNNRFDSAWHYYHLFDTTKITGKDLRVYLASTGETYLLQKEYEKALPNFIRALEMHKKLNDLNEIKRVLLDISKTYLALGKADEAINYARESLAISEQTKSRQFIRDAYEVFYNAFDQMKLTDSAYYYYKKYIAIKDIVVSEQTKGKFVAYNYTQQLKLLQAENGLREQQLIQASQQKIFLIIGIVIIMLSGLIVLRNTTLKRKNEANLREIAETALQKQKMESLVQETKFENQKKELEMKSLRSQMNPHFIFNSLNSINRFILQNNRNQASEYLTKFSRLMRMILQNSQSSLITLESELDALSLYMEMEALRFNFHFSHKIIYPDDLDIAIIKVPPLIIQPFVENAIWHGLMHKEEQGQLEIEIAETNGQLVFRIFDNGIGRKQSALLASKSATKHKSMGLKITSDRIAMMLATESNDSSVVINDLVYADGNAAGTEVIIKIPLIYGESDPH